MAVSLIYVHRGMVTLITRAHDDEVFAGICDEAGDVAGPGYDGYVRGDYTVVRNGIPQPSKTVNICRRS